MWFTTRSRKYRSCVTMTSPPLYRRSQSSSQATISVSRWFVGSSSTSTSAGWMSAAHKAARRRSPPESVPMRRSVSPRPSFVSIAFASYSFSARNCGGMLAKTCSRIVQSSSISGFCGR